jgi:phosphoenolpyruvate carboxykinase (ATP)
MSAPVLTISPDKLVTLGLKNTENIHYQLSPEELVYDSLRIGEGLLNDTGALVIKTGEFTGRSPKDKFTVKDETTADSVHWNEFNIPIEKKYFDIVKKKIID